MVSKSKWLKLLAAGAIVAGGASCGPAEEGDDVGDEVVAPCTPGDGDSFMADTETCAEDPKADTGYVTNLDAREVEFSLEADISADSYSLARAPLKSGQFALTVFRQNQDIYIASLAEDFSAGPDTIEWKVGTAWKKWGVMSSTERAAAKHYRLNKVNAVILKAKSRGLVEGKTFTAQVPLKPTSLFSDVGRKCEGGDGHIQADSEVYWYVWDPSKAGCTAAQTTATATITKLLPKGGTVYPEYGKLYADKKLDVIAFFGQVDHGAISDSDYAFTIIREFERYLVGAGFKKGTATKGMRYTRVKSGITANVDIYTPREFSGLGDTANEQNFFDGVNSHELIIFNGHSMLGASDYWADNRLYANKTKYQVFLYNGCLGYEYYVAPILTAKGEANVDVVSNVIETPFAVMSKVGATAISLMLSKAESGGTSSWQTLIGKMNSASVEQAGSGSAFYGVSGARNNTYRPAGR